MQLAIENVMRQMDVRSLLPAISAPTLLMHRVDDKIEDIGASRYLAGEIRGAELIELEGADHFPWAGDHEPVVREIERFVASLRDHDEADVADRVLASVMFTDIVDSTAHAALRRSPVALDKRGPRSHRQSPTRPLPRPRGEDDR